MFFLVAAEADPRLATEDSLFRLDFDLVQLALNPSHSFFQFFDLGQLVVEQKQLIFELIHLSLQFLDHGVLSVVVGLLGQQFLL